MGRSRGPESSGFDRTRGLCGRLPRGDPLTVAESWVRHTFNIGLVAPTHKS
jgi:hypothetical protein